MDPVAIYLGVLALVVWVGCGLAAYHSFLADMYSIIRDAAGGEDAANIHFERWRRSRNIGFVHAYFLLTGPLSLIIVMIATRGFRTGFRR